MVSGCKTALNELRSSWSHDSICASLVKELTNLRNKQLVLYADIADYKSPTIITRSSHSLDIVIVDVNKLYLIDLTVGFETRITINTERKK